MTPADTAAIKKELDRIADELMAARPDSPKYRLLMKQLDALLGDPDSPKTDQQDALDYAWEHTRNDD
jgi:hypothetical protein